jgi:DNA-binding response OmpR family regulator
LSKTQIEILASVASAYPELRSAETIRYDAWDDGVGPSKSTFYYAIERIRDKIRTIGLDLDCVYGAGYRLVVVDLPASVEKAAA